MRTRFIWALCKVFLFLAVFFFIKEPMAQAQESALCTKELSIKYAAIQAASVVINQLSTKEIEGLAEDCTTFILNNISKHKKIGKSRNLVRDHIRKSVDKAFDEDLKKIYKSFESQDVKFLEDEYKRDIKERFETQIDQNLSQNINHNFKKIFEKARGAAVNQQLARISLSVYPSQEEVENIDQAGWRTQDIISIKEELINRMRGVEVLFEENEPKVKQAANEIITDIKRQFQEQQNALEDYVSEASIIKKQIINEMHKNVRIAINEMIRNAKQNQKIYKIFPTVKKKIAQKAEYIEKDRFKVFINDFNFSINSEALKTAIQSNLKDHRNRDNSLKIISKSLFPDAAGEVVDIYSSEIASSPECQQFKNHLKHLVAKNEEIRSTLKSVILSAVRNPIKEIRSDIAEAQIKRHFYPIFSGEWAVPEKILKKIAFNNFGVHSFKQSLELPFISRGSKPYNRSSLLGETENKVLSKVGKLLSEGERAWDGQLDIVKGKEDVIKVEFEKLTKNDLILKSEEQWISYYTKQVEKEWSDNRFNRIWRGFSEPPPNSPIKYAPLFGYMREEIKKIVHNFFEATKKRIELERIEIKKQMELERQRLEEERLKREEEKQKGPADVGGDQSVEKKDPGKSGAQPHPTEGGVPAKIPWWFWLLLLLLIIVLVLIIVLLYRRLRKKRRLKKVHKPKTPWIPIKNLRSISFPVDDLDKSISVFSELVGVQPIKKSDTEAVFKKGFFMVVFRKSGQ